MVSGADLPLNSATVRIHFSAKHCYRWCMEFYIGQSIFTFDDELEEAMFPKSFFFFFIVIIQF